MKFPVDAPKAKVLRALGTLGFKMVREREHVSMMRQNPDGTRTPLTIPNHPTLKASTLRTICSQSGISRADSWRRIVKVDRFFKAFPSLVSMFAAPEPRSR